MKIEYCVEFGERSSHTGREVAWYREVLKCSKSQSPLGLGTMGLGHSRVSSHLGLKGLGILSQVSDHLVSSRRFVQAHAVTVALVLQY